MKRICIIAPHPDDELLGAGGTALKCLDAGEEVFWLIVTAITPEFGFTKDRVDERAREIELVGRSVGFTDIRSLRFPTTKLDTTPQGDLVSAVKSALEDWQPSTVIVPWQNDAHTDHLAVYNAALAATKSFRAPYVRTVLAMEILSETNFARAPGFEPNWYCDISSYVDRKIEVLKVFGSELSEHPFPRSEQSVRALATLRGSEVGCAAAEAFHLIRHNDARQN